MIHTAIHPHIESILTLCRLETLTVSEDPDEMLHNAGEIITYGPSIYTVQ